ncbi:LolA family protein [Desulfolucanica intricata]|uniref:LolA family protein n=1 Tax=Desulfolucanica intricata TaxID=1285191 RepID=UPI000834EFC9|nr:outer membrane lipoprotein carrier protein LolA [Desulfolucanica intricata]
MSLFPKIKGLFLIMVLVLACLGLAGCGEDQEESGSPTAGKNQESPAAKLLAKGEQIEGMSFDYKFTGEGLQMSGKMWVQDEKVKTESTTEGHKVIMISDGKALYSYTPEQKMAVKFTLAETEQQIASPYDYAKVISTAAVEELDTKEYDGAECKVFLVKDKNSKEEFKMWVREDYGIPVRVEAEDGSKTVMEYKNLVVGALPADTFKLPEGVQIQDMENVMTRMPEKPLIP